MGEIQNEIKPGWKKSELWLSVLWIVYSAFEILPGEYDWYVKVPALSFAILLIAYWVWKRNSIYTANMNDKEASNLLNMVFEILQAASHGKWSEIIDIISGQEVVEDKEKEVEDKKEEVEEEG